MHLLKREVEANFAKFTKNWRKELVDVTAALDTEEDKFLESYLRLVSFQAWRTKLLEQHISKESLAFFLEAQNDAVLSHVLARSGAFNPALKSLRSTIENVCNCLFYMDHPVEYQLWQQGKHKIGFKELYSYLSVHPQITTIPLQVQRLPNLQSEYGTLSRAVHASSKAFRMTDGADKPLLLSSANSRLGPWLAREKTVVHGLNLLLLTVFREHLEQARLIDLRKAISLAIPESQYAAIKDQMKVTLFKS